MRVVLSGAIRGSSSKGADTKTDWGQGRLVNGAGLGHLQKQGFIGLLERRPLENDNAISAYSGSQAVRAEAVTGHWKLLCCRPFLLDLAAQLYLRRHPFDLVIRRIDHPEEHGAGLPPLHHLPPPSF